MGGKCSPSGGINKSEGRIGSLDWKDAKPNSRTDLYENGELIQSRWYDGNGFVSWNRDYKHANPYNDHTFPHDHEWKWDSKTGGLKRQGKNLDENPGFC